VPLHPLAHGFAAVADHYERGRPEYPPAVVGALAAELDLDRGARLLDLAAGTGKLTRALVTAGFDVAAVEPLAELRESLARHVGAARARDGRAEAIPGGTGEFAAVTVADAFHWFDHARALEEIVRVLRPGGGLAIITTVRDFRGAPWGHEVGSLIAQLRPSHPHFDGPRWQDVLREDGRWSAPREVKITMMQAVTATQVIDYVASMSWVATLAEDERARAMERVSGLVLAGETPAELPVHFALGLSVLRR